MLGEKIADERGKVTGQRVLSSEGQSPKVETSFEAKGTLLGVEATDIGTYSSVMRPDGTVFGQGQGVVMTKDGEGVTWVGSGVGIFTGEGSAISYRGAVYYQTASEKLARLNRVAGVFEYEVDADGNTHGVIWEWK